MVTESGSTQFLGVATEVESQRLEILSSVPGRLTGIDRGDKVPKPLNGSRDWIYSMNWSTTPGNVVLASASQRSGGSASAKMRQVRTCWQQRRWPYRRCRSTTWTVPVQDPCQ
jgi:hypothetical protein